MCCEPSTGRRAFGVWACGPDCCGGSPFSRRFVTSKERQECLEEYRDQLENELAGVKQRIQEIEGK
jgi:hypothetical protein